LGGPSAPNAGSTERINEYQIDDGSGENSVGLTAGGNSAFLNLYNVAANQQTLTQIRIGFGSPAALNGASIFVGAWAVSGTGATARPGALLGGGNFTISGAQAAAPFTNLAVFNIADINLGSVGTPFFIGFLMAQQASQFPAAFDQTAPLPNRSYVGISTTAWDPANAGAVANTWGSIESLAPTLLGNWMIRGDAVPAPGAAAVLGLAGLAGLRRRR
jgi:uncharacterized protein (TIGR03382 family)